MYFTEKVQKWLISCFQSRKSEERMILDGAGKNRWVSAAKRRACVHGLGAAVAGLRAAPRGQLRLREVRFGTAGLCVRRFPQSRPDPWIYSGLMLDGCCESLTRTGGHKSYTLPCLHRVCFRKHNFEGFNIGVIEKINGTHQSQQIFTSYLSINKPVTV